MTPTPTDWRAWLLFVFTNNTPADQAMSDAELKAAVCRAADAGSPRQREALLATVIIRFGIILLVIVAIEWWTR